MENLFELITTKEKGEGKISVRLGIRLNVAGHETLCPISGSCDAYEAFEKASQVLNDQLEQMKQKARTLFSDPSAPTGLDIGPDMPAEEIWNILSTIVDEAMLVATFNDLDTSQRQTVAEHVLTQCNIFSGKAAVFSKRYDSESGLMT